MAIAIVFVAFTPLFSQSRFETVLQNGHSLSALACAWTPDGKFAVTAGKDKKAILWDVKTGLELRSFIGHTQPIESVDISPDGRWLATGSWDKTIKIWELSTGKLLYSLEGYKRAITSVQFHPDGDKIIIAGTDRVAQLWHLEADSVLHTYETRPGQRGTQVAFGSKASHVFTGNDNGELTIYSTDNPTDKKTFRNIPFSSCGGCFTSFGLHPNGQQVVSVARNSPFTVWDMEGNILSSSGRTFEEPVFISFVNKGEEVLMVTEDSIFVADAKNSVIARSFAHLGKQANEAALSPDGDKLLVADALGVTFIYNINSGREISRLDGLQDAYALHKTLGLDMESIWDVPTYKFVNLKRKVMPSPDGQLLAFPKFGNGIDLLDAQNFRLKKVLETNHPVTCLKFSTDGKWLVAGDAGAQMTLWKLPEGEMVYSKKAHYSMLMDLAFSHDSKKIASTGMEGDIFIWETESGTILNEILYRPEANRIDPAITLAFTPNDLYLVSATLAKKLMMWEVDSKEVFRAFYGHTDLVTSIMFSNANQMMVTSSLDGSIRRWDYRTGFQQDKISIGMPVNDMLHLPDHNKIAAITEQGGLEIVDLHTMQTLHKNIAGALSANSIQQINNKLLLVGNSTGSVKVIDAISNDVRFHYFRYGESDWMAINPDGYFYGSGASQSQICFVSGMDVFVPDQFFEKYYYPQLIPDALSDDHGSTKGSNLMEESADTPPPIIEITVPKEGSNVSTQNLDVMVKVTNTGDGIDEIRLLHNGKRIKNEGNRGARQPEKGKAVYESFQLNLVPGTNYIQATAFNKSRISSIHATSKVYFESKETVLPDCYILAIGINEYKNQKLNLSFAKADAEAFVKEMHDHTSKVYHQVHETILLDENASKANINQALSKISSIIQSTDVLYIYYAGHGSIVDDEFYFIPHECTRLYDKNELRDEAISAIELQQFLKEIKALKQVVVMDACQSAGSIDALAMRGAVEEKAIAQLSRSAGVHILASSGTDQFSGEFKELGHGLFTYILLEGLSGKADGAPQDGKVTVYELKSYLDNMVPELSQELKGKTQYPHTFSQGNDFPVVLVDGQ